MARQQTASFLFVDQDLCWLGALRRASKDLPGPKHFAQSAEEAWGMIRTYEPAVVVSGYTLPEGDGLTLLEKVQEQHPTVACVLHTSRPAKQLRAVRGIGLVEKGAAPGRLEAVLRSLWVALMGKMPPTP